MSARRLTLLATLLGTGAPACDGEDGEDTGGEFIALQHDFDGLAQWMVMWSGAGEALKAHPAGTRTVYMKQAPPAGDEFPRGTIIVKTMESSDVDSGLLIHAMAKRGGDFNPEGHGWEWFELALDDSDRPVIIWRGEAPPEGECYGCPPGVDPATELEMADCNSCHLGAADNDLVHSVPLP
jgi:hypothetical protein